MKNAEAMALDEVVAELKELTPQVRKAFQEAGGELDASKITAFGDGLDTGQKSERLAHANERLSKLAERKLYLEQMAEGQAKADAMADWLASPRDPAPGAGKGAPRLISLADAAMKADVREIWLKRAQNSRAVEVDVDVKAWLDHEVKTVMSTGAGFAPQAIRSGVVVPYAYQAPAVIDLVPVVPTSQSAYVFMEQTTRTNNAAEAAESANGALVTLGESAFAYTERSETVRKIGHFIPVTDEQLEDIEGIDALLRADMATGIRQRASSQILNGDGNAPNWEGLLDSGRSTTDVDGTGLFIADIVDKCIEEVRVTGFTEPSGIVMNSRDWHGYRRATTTDGLYIAGNPSENIAPVMWGLPVALTTEITQGTVLVGNFRDYCRIAVKRGIEISVSDNVASYFIQGVQVIKAEMRAAFAVLRETAFAKSNDVVVS